jgi:sialate O-acetylesterase
MQIPMRRVKYMYPEELQNPNPSIRQFTVAQRTDFHAPQDDLEEGGWAGASPKTIPDFSAVGYFFAKRLYEQYHVPMGLILCAIGGTPIHAWMSRDALHDFPDLLKQADQCADDEFVLKTQAEDKAQAEHFFRVIDESDRGLKQKWYAAEYDDSHWEERPLLSPFHGPGSVWLRKTLEIPPALWGKPAMLFLGTLIDWDTVYVNGQIVGGTTYRYPPREYFVPSLPEGRCVITVRAIAREDGGFTPGKQYLLATEAGSIDLNGDWRFRSGGQGVPYVPESTFHYMPTGLYNGMLSPLARFSIKGAIWYQGESDTASPGRYAEKFQAMVSSWRAAWGVDFPFLFVELPHWEGGPDWDALRQEQRLCLNVPKTGMAAAFDLGEHNDLHPQGKQLVGARLARLAMRVAYGETLPPSPFEIVAP